MNDPFFEDCRPSTRARWKEIQHLLTPAINILDIGCAHGDGCEFVPAMTDYFGVDVNTEKIPFQARYWNDYESRFMAWFFETDFRTFIEPEDHWDIIVSLETLEHVEDGLEWAQKLKQYCNRLIISVPYRGPEGNGHVLLGLTPEDFPGFTRINGEANYTMFLLWDKE